MNNASPETRQQRRFKSRRDQKARHYVPAAKNAFYRAMATAKNAAEALKAAMSLGPIAMKLAMLELAHKLGAYKSRGHGKCAPSYAHGRGSKGGSWPKAHQSGQECLRRAVGGWAYNKRLTGLSKREILELIATQGKVRLETAIEMVLGMQRVQI